MNIVSKLKEIVQSSTGLTLHYGDSAEVNEKLDFAAFPCAYAIAIEGSTINMDGGSLKERPTIVIAFASLQQDEDSEQAEVLIEQRKQDAFKFIAALRRSSDLRLVSINQAGRLYKQMNEIVCGYSLNITIEELVGYVECPQLLKQNLRFKRIS